MRILRSFLFMLLAMAAANVHAGDDYIWGTVASISGDTVQIDSFALLRPSVGDKVEIVVNVPGGGVAVVATGKVAKLDGLKTVAKIERATGKIEVGQRTRIAHVQSFDPKDREAADRMMRKLSTQLGGNAPARRNASADSASPKQEPAAGGPMGALTWPKLFGGQVNPRPKRNPSQPKTDKQGHTYVEAAAIVKLEGQLEVMVILRRYESAVDAAEAATTMLPAVTKMQQKMITALVKDDPEFLAFMRAMNFVAEDRREGDRRLVMVTLGPGRDRKPRRLKSLRIFQVYERYLMTFVVKNEGRWPEDPAPLKPGRKSMWPGLMQKQTTNIVADLEAYGKRVADSWEGRGGSHSPKKEAVKIRTGDRIETLVETPVKSGKETLATVAAGTKLIAGNVQGTWVGVTVERDGRQVKGWIFAKHLKRVVQKATAKPSDSAPKSDASAPKPAASATKPDTSAIEPTISGAKIHIETSEQSLAKIPKYLPMSSPKKLQRYFRASPDGRHVVHLMLYPDEFSVVVDGEEGKRFDTIIDSSLQFTSDGRQYTYVARHGDGVFVVIDGTEHGPYDEVGKSMPLLGPNGRRVCFTARRGKQWLVVVDGKEQQPHEQVAGLPVLSPDGQRFAYAVVDSQEHRVVVDGVPQRAYEKVASKSIRFSPDGRHVAYTARRDKRRYVVVDGVESEPLGVIFPGGEVVFDDADTLRTLGIRNRELVRVETQIVEKSGPAKGIDLRSKTTPLGILHRGLPPGSIIVSPDGRRLAWVSLRPDRKFEVFVDGIRSKPYDGIRKRTLTFSPDGKRFACGVNRDGKQIVLVDGVEGEAFDQAMRPIFSPDGSHIVYMAMRGKGRLAVVDGIAGAEYDSIDPKSLTFSPNGRVGYVARRGERRLVVVDGKEGAEYDDVTPPVFGPEGTRVAYFATRGAKQLVVVDGLEGPEYDAVKRDTLVFSSDGKHVAYFAVRGDQHFLVRDGKEEASPYTEIVRKSPTFSPDGRFVYAAFRNPKPVPWLHLVIDGREEAQFQDIKGPLVFSRDGKRLARKSHDSYRKRLPSMA